MDTTDKNGESWMFSRQKFLKTLVLSGVALQLPWISACSKEEDKIENFKPFSLHQYKTVRSLQDILFPDDGNGPGARQINATPYLVWVLNDSNLDPEENQYIIDRINEFDTFTIEEQGEVFYELSEGNQEHIVALAHELPWGEQFFSRLLTLIFEALLLDPVYGSNPNEIGWEWLSHNPGFPRPSKEIQYPQILNRL